MYRVAIARLARRSACQVIRRSEPIVRLITRSSIVSRTQLGPALFQGARCFSAAAGLNQGEVEGRIVDILKNFDKVQDPSKLSPTSHFSNDLGLDSLDTVEVVMAIEEEFSIEIPDKDADAIHSVDQAVSYILSSPDAH